MKLAILLTMPVVMVAQAPATQAPPTQLEQQEKGTIRGVARDGRTGDPVLDVEITTALGRITAVSDAQGRFVLTGIDPGRVQISARAPRKEGFGFPPASTKFVLLGSGQTLDADLSVVFPALIRGRVIDQNDQPAPNVAVFAVAREYQLGEVRYIFAGSGRTDDLGHYAINGQPGRSYLIYVRPGSGNTANSDAPRDPDLRRPSFVPTYYPSVDTLSAAQLVALHSGDEIQNVDIRLIRGKSFCVEATATDLPPGATYDISETSPHSGSVGQGGFYSSGRRGTIQEGKTRLCGLAPGEYRMRGGAMGPIRFTIVDRDVTIPLGLQSKIKTEFEVVWDQNSAPANFTIPADWRVTIQALTDTSRATFALNAPEPFELFAEDHAVNLNFRTTAPAGVYVKDVLYGDKSMRLTPFRPGAAPGGSKLRFVLAQDGANVTVHVADREGMPMSDINVILYPATAITAPALAELATGGLTDSTGAWLSPRVAPGKYFAIATRTPLDKSFEVIAALLRSVQKAKPVEVAPGSRGDVTLELTALE